MSQENSILRHLRKGRKLTSLQALERFQTLRLASRINALRNKGHNIESQLIPKNGKWVAEYKLFDK